jgi:translation elongation factor EF-1alpha
MPFLIQVGFKEKNLTFVPISGLKGLNLESRST